MAKEADRSTFVVRWLPGADRLAQAHRAAGQQLDNLCGAHWGSILLAADGVSVDAESLAADAGTALPAGDPYDFIPDGSQPRRDYRLPLPVATSPEDSGTSILGLVDAVTKASAGARALVPLRATWTEERVSAVLRLCREQPGWGAVPLANIRTGSLWGSRLPLADVLAWLAGSEVPRPPSDWDVGHFVTIAGTLEGSARSFLVVRDSYPAFGWDAHHLQPPEAMAAALERGDGREGGIALYVAQDDRPDVERAAKDSGFEIGGWDNGTPWPPGRDEGGTDR
jgi:hypothetical protein